MDITPAIPIGKKIITSYGMGNFKINDEVFKGNIMIFPDTVSLWPNAGHDSITAESLYPLLETREDIEILIIGCGTGHQPVPKDIARLFREKGISVEIMTTGAACRTYNVLLSEGRQLAAALIAV